MLIVHGSWGWVLLGHMSLCLIVLGLPREQCLPALVKGANTQGHQAQHYLPLWPFCPVFTRWGSRCLCIESGCLQPSSKVTFSKINSLNPFIYWCIYSFKKLVIEHLKCTRLCSGFRAMNKQWIRQINKTGVVSILMKVIIWKGVRQKTRREVLYEK